MLWLYEVAVVVGSTVFTDSYMFEPLIAIGY